MSEKIKNLETVINRQAEQLTEISNVLGTIDRRTPGTGSKRTRFDWPLLPPANKAPQKIVNGTNDSEAEIQIVPPMFWFHISPFGPDTSEEQVTNFVRKLLISMGI
jgi:hypothetical protein